MNSGVIEFNGDESEYLHWLNRNPTGFVVNTTRSMSPAYFLLHRANCKAISSQTSGKKFTSRNYIKICAGRVAQLRVYMEANKRQDFSGYCGSCNPGSADADFEIDKFDNEVTKALKDGASARAKRLKLAGKKPIPVQVVVMQFKRNPDVVAEVLFRADGRCQCCGNPAPFNRTKDGSPYLEVHHRKRLADGGEDSVENAIALCPNCHRQQHFGEKTI